MSAVLVAGSIAFVVCLVATPLCRDLFLNYGLVDKPDQQRKIHLKPIPRIGGLPIVFSYAVALGAMMLASGRADVPIQHQKLFLLLFPATALIFIVGLVDDLIGLAPKQKLAGQFIAASLAVGLGARLTIFGGAPHAAWVTIPLSIVWLVGCTNAVNLIDGLDGLASGVGLFAAMTTLLAALATGNTGLALATMPLVGCLLAFLKYNFSPASIFLGDCGSLTIGFMLGCFGLVWSQHSGTMLGMVAPLMALALPLTDVGLSIGRRWLRRAPVFQGDRGHIHHMVLARGFKPHVATLILYGVSATAASLALLHSVSTHPFRGFVLILFCALVLTGINYLGYIELTAARKTLSRKTVIRVLREEIYLQDLNQAMNEANTVDEIWSVIRKTCEDMRFASVEMILPEGSFREVFDHADSNHGRLPSWTMTVVAGHNGHIKLNRFDELSPPRLMGSVLGVLQTSLRDKQFSRPLETVSPEERIVSEVV